MKNLTENEDKELVQSLDIESQEIEWNDILEIIKKEIENKGEVFNGDNFKRRKGKS